MSETVGNVGGRAVQCVGGVGPAAKPPAAAPVDVLPSPEMEIGAAKSDVMAMLYALTAKQRDTSSNQGASAAKRKETERQHAFEQMREELQKAKEAKEDGGWLGTVSDILDAATDAAVGGNPLQDVAHELAESTGIKAFDVAYDFIRPDALLHGAVVLTSAATGEDSIAQAYDIGAATSSLKTRFQGAADTTGQAEVMDAYAITRDGIAAAMVTVGTCGVGTVAVVAVASSAVLMLEAKADLLGKLGVADKEKMWIRLGAQASMVVGSAAAAFVGAGKIAPGGVKAAVAITNGANLVGRGSVQVGQAIYQHEADEHLAESAKHQNTQHRVDREQERLLAGLRDVSKSYQRSLDTIASTMNERDQIPLMLARHIA